MDFQTQVSEIKDKLINKAICEFELGLDARSLNFELVLNNRMRTALGRAILRPRAKLEIHLNARALAENVSELESTLAHELAHLIAYELHGPKAANHGPLWQHVMVRLGYSPERTHSVDVSAYRTRQRTTELTCGCTVYNLKPGRVNRIKRGATYRCRKCKNELKFITEASIS